jgi:hypothetical protein
MLIEQRIKKTTLREDLNKDGILIIINDMMLMWILI